MKRYLFSGVGLLVLAVGFLAFNMASRQLLSGARLDLTENQQYTLSQGTKNLLKSLDEPINVYLYYSEAVGQEIPQVRVYAQQVRDLLNEYALRADGKLVIHAINPEPFSEAEDRASEQGVKPVDLGGRKLYFGLAATNSVGGKQVLPFFHPQNAATLEYDLSKLIYSLEHPQKPVIGVLSSLRISGRWNTLDRSAIPPWQVYREASQLFTIKDLEAPIEAIPEDVKVLWVVQPKDVDAKTEYAIDQFLMRGGQAVIFVDPFAESEPAPATEHPMLARALPHYSDLPALFKAWGLKYDARTVVLAKSQGLSVHSPTDGRVMQHPAILGLRDGSLDKNSLITSQLRTITASYTGAIDWDAKPGITVTPLLTTAPDGRLIPAQQAQEAFDPGILVTKAAEGEGKPRVLAVRVSGVLPSAFEAPPAGVTNPHHLKQSKGPVNVIVAADVDLLADDYWLQKEEAMGQVTIRPFADNGDFVVNALDQLTGSSDLIGIRSRAVDARPFERVQALRADAEERFRAKEQELQQRLDETQQKLDQLKTADDGKVVLTPEQQQALERFQAEKLRIRKELRDVRYQLDKDIQSLGTHLKWANIAAMPALVAVFGVAVAGLRFRRRRLARGKHRE